MYVFYRAQCNHITLLLCVMAIVCRGTTTTTFLFPPSSYTPLPCSADDLARVGLRLLMCQRVGQYREREMETVLNSIAFCYSNLL